MHVLRRYLDPYYTFPSQREVIEEGVRLATKAKYEDGNTLFVVGAYQIGKERFAVALAKAMHARIYINDRKKRYTSRAPLLTCPSPHLKIQLQIYLQSSLSIRRVKGPRDNK